MTRFKATTEEVWEHDRQNEDEEETEPDITFTGHGRFNLMDEESAKGTSDFETPRPMNKNWPYFAQLLAALKDNHSSDLQKLEKQDIQPLETPQGKEKKKPCHCFRSFSLVEHVDWKVSEGLQLSDIETSRAFLRVGEAEKFSMSKESFCIHGTGGLLVQRTGEAMVIVVDEDHAAEIQDWDTYLKNLPQKDAEPPFDKSSCKVVLTPDIGIWVPFGSIAIVLYLSGDRSTKTVKKDKSGRPSKAKEPSREFGSCVWLPCLNSQDAVGNDDMIRSVMCRLLTADAVIPQAFKQAGYVAWKQKMEQR